MKKIAVLFALTAFFCTGQIYAQQTEKNAPDQKKEQIAAYEDLIKRSKDPKEIVKAEAMLAELKGKQTLSPAEEQKKMSETATPAEYNAWKAKTPQKLITKPEDDK